MNHIIDPLETVRRFPQIIASNIKGTSESDDGITTITVDDTIIKECFQRIGSIAKSYQKYLR